MYASLSLGRVFTLLAVAWLGYILWLTFSRLYLSPLARFPGPKLAALTGWYQAYFDLIKKGGGQFPFEIKRMHQQYGPIVRINPEELHVDDPEFYDVLYPTGRSFDKLERLQYRFSIPKATFSTVDAETHKVRRAALAPFFSKAKIRELNEEIQELMNEISSKLSTDYTGCGRPINIQDVWSSFTADAIMNIVFVRPMNLYKHSEFKSPFTMAVNSVAVWCHLTLYFGFILTALNNLPDWVAMRLFPPFRPVILFRQEMERQISDLLEGRNEEMKNATRKTVFAQILESNLGASELHPQRLLQEAQSLVGAGLETTAWILTIGTFYILDNDQVLNRLKAELVEAIPDALRIPSWSQLEQIPYLDAVVKESLRLGFGTVERLPRVNRTGVWMYKEWRIPPSTPVSMDQYHMHMDSSIYEDPAVFRPERWLQKPVGPDGTKPLTHYLTTFGKGSRMCLGINLAYAELFIALATIFRRHDLQLFETTKSDVEFYAEHLKPTPRPGSRGVRVLLR